MKDLNRYTIYCTPEQTNKALKLGAQIETWNFGILIKLPTAEQLVGWMEDGLLEEVHVEQDIDGMWSYMIYRNCKSLFGISNLYPSRKEATLAAIDAALEYLLN